jgi:hypothetical protein
MAKQVTTQQLHQELTITKNSVNHIHDCIHRLETEIKDNKVFYTVRLDRLDNRMWVLMGGVLSTLLTVITTMFIT